MQQNAKRPATKRVRVVGTAAGEHWQAALIQAVTIAAAFGLLVLIQRFTTVLLLLFLGIGVGQALNTPVLWLSRWLSRALAVILVYLILAALVAILFAVAIPPLWSEARAFVLSAPHLISHLQGQVNHVTPGASSLIGQLKGPLGSLSGLVLHLPLKIASGFLELVIVIFFSIYWLLTAPALNRFALSLVPVHLKKEAGDIFDELGAVIGGYFRGDVLDALLIGAIAYLGMRLIGVPFPLVIGLATFLGDLIPLVGPTIAQFLAAGIALTESPLQAAITLAFFLVLQQVDGNVTLPAITGGAARIPSLLIVFALVAGGLTGGVLGAIIAIPLFGAIRVVVVRVAAPIVRNWWGVETEDRA